MSATKKPLSSYLHFCNDRRQQVVEKHPDARIGEIQKIISAEWRDLSDAEKEHYVQLAIKDKERYQKELLDNPIEIVNTDPMDEAKQAIIYSYPLGRVKKIVQSDPEVGKVSKDALIAITKASELFAQLLATKSYEHALSQKKMSIKASDITRTIHSTPNMDWLRDDFPHIRKGTPAINESELQKSKEKEIDRKKSLPDPHSFFTPNASYKQKKTQALEVETLQVDQEVSNER